MNDSSDGSSGGATRDSARRSPLDWAGDTGMGDAVIEEISRLSRIRRQRRARRMIGTASACAVITAGLVFFRSKPTTTRALPNASSMASAPAQRTLPDGSTVELKPGAEIAIAYGEKIRGITLLKGEAHFEVQKDPERPFIVSAGGIEVRAVGTAFDVDLRPASVEVLVTHGRVAVERAGATTDRIPMPAEPAENAHVAYVDAGSKVVLDLARPAQTPVPAVVSVSDHELDERLAWRVPRLDLSGTPLEEVIVAFNRYSGKHLVLANAELGALQLSGVLRADNVDALLRLLEANYGIKPAVSGTEITLARAP